MRLKEPVTRRAFLESAAAAGVALAGVAAEPSGSVLPLVLPGPCPPDVEAMRRLVYRAAQRQAHSLLPTVRPWKDDYLRGRRTWRAGEVISEFAVTIRCVQ
ncbi:MAG: twin-arginine translocation signal domain-containing protein [Planctomycetes bacterium]|nr:twin-arginine translocation signal domain-containing protein [Planctomycetota bacterium]